MLKSVEELELVEIREKYARTIRGGIVCGVSPGVFVRQLVPITRLPVPVFHLPEHVEESLAWWEMRL